MKLVEIIKSNDNISYTLFTEGSKYDISYSEIKKLLDESELNKLENKSEILKEFTIEHWKNIIMPIIKRTSAVRKQVAGQEKVLSHFLGISGTPASPILHFKTQATFSDSKYRTKIQLVDLNKWRKGKYLYSMNGKEFKEILNVCEIKLECTCKFWHWGGLKYMATELDSAISKTSIANPVWRQRKGYSEPSLCKHLVGVLRLIKPNSDKILRTLKDRYSSKFRGRKENIEHWNRIFKEAEITSAREVKLIYDSIMKIIEMDLTKFNKILEITGKIKYNDKNEVIIPKFVELIKTINSYIIYKVAPRSIGGNEGKVGKTNELYDIINAYSKPIQNLFVQGSDKYYGILEELQMDYLYYGTHSIFDLANYKSEKDIKEYINKRILRTAGERKDSVEGTKSELIDVTKKAIVRLGKLTKEVKVFFSSIKNKAPEVEQFTYKNVRFIITRSSTDPDPKELIEASKFCIDKMDREKLTPLFSKAIINIVDSQTFKREYGGRGHHNASAYYSHKNKEIYMPNDEIGKGGIHNFIHLLYHEFGHYVHLSLEKKDVYEDWLNIYNYIMKNISGGDSKPLSDKKLKDQLEDQGFPVKKVTYLDSGLKAGSYQIDMTFTWNYKSPSEKHVAWLWESLIPALNRNGYLDYRGKKFDGESFPLVKNKMKSFYLKLPKQDSSNEKLVPSEYSKKNERELFAEIFAYVMMPNYAHVEIHPDLLQAFKNVIKGIHGIGFKENEED